MERALSQTRDELIQAAKLAMLGQMSASISHEINQPLSAIRSYTDNARQFLQQDRCEDVSWNLEQIAELIGNMTQISSQLKLFARKTDGQRSPVSLRNVIESSKRILLPQLKRTQTEVRVPHLKQDIEVVADPVRLEQVLVNLIANAMNAMEQQSERWVDIGIETGLDLLRLTIRDNGPGISEEHLKHIFDPFFTTKEKSRGTGLGLASAYGIIKNHGGVINARSRVGHGTTFTIHLPTTEAMVVTEPVREQKISGGYETVLLVDDEEMILEVGQAMLEKLGYHVMEARTGEEAIKLVKSYDGRIDFVLLDVILPDMDGSHIYPLLVEARPGIKVIVCSGFALDGPARQILESGAESFVQKPFTMAALSTILKKIFNEDE
jgi:CheY-like chemotaxis protein